MIQEKTTVNNTYLLLCHPPPAGNQQPLGSCWHGPSLGAEIYLTRVKYFSHTMGEICRIRIKPWNPTVKPIHHIDHVKIAMLGWQTRATVCCKPWCHIFVISRSCDVTTLFLQLLYDALFPKTRLGRQALAVWIGVLSIQSNTVNVGPYVRYYQL